MFRETIETNFPGKVFEVGNAKTGTSSLCKAFRILDLRPIGFVARLQAQCRAGDYVETLEMVEHYDAFADGPWHNKGMYKIFDRRFPGSKFILLERDIQDWIRSHEHHFSAEMDSKATTPVRNYLERKERLIDRHITKYNDIKTFFQGRPDDLLVMNICAGEGWERLCPFLGLAIPKREFPHENRTDFGDSS